MWIVSVLWKITIINLKLVDKVGKQLYPKHVLAFETCVFNFQDRQ